MAKPVTEETPRPGPLGGVRIVDLTSVVSGPMATQLLGDLGAEVLKVEPPGGDFSRLSGGAPHAGLNGFFAQHNRNKRSLVLDLKIAEAREVLFDLASSADVVVENFRPGVADRIGIGWDALRSRNERLIFASISGFGASGPYAAQPAYDPLIQGLTGFMPVQGGSGPPRMVQTVVADKVGGLTAALAVAAALYERERSGQGQRVDVPMLDAYAAFILPDQLAGRTFADLTPASTDVSNVYRSFETRDGAVVGIASRTDSFVPFAGPSAAKTGPRTKGSRRSARASGTWARSMRCWRRNCASWTQLISSSGREPKARPLRLFWTSRVFWATHRWRITRRSSRAKTRRRDRCDCCGPRRGSAARPRRFAVRRRAWRSIGARCSPSLATTKPGAPHSSGRARSGSGSAPQRTALKRERRARKRRGRSSQG